MQTNHQDFEHLKILSIFHYIVAALAAFFSSFALIHLAVGVGLVAGWGDPANQDVPAHWMGWFFIVVAAAVLLSGWAFAVCITLAGRFLSQYRNYTFCVVMAGVVCMFAPFGTVLGALTLVLLLREPVKGRFAEST